MAKKKRLTMDELRVVLVRDGGLASYDVDSISSVDEFFNNPLKYVCDAEEALDVIQGEGLLSESKLHALRQEADEALLKKVLNSIDFNSVSKDVREHAKDFIYCCREEVVDAVFDGTNDTMTLQELRDATFDVILDMCGHFVDEGYTEDLMREVFDEISDNVFKRDFINMSCNVRYDRSLKAYKAKSICSTCGHEE